MDGNPAYDIYVVAHVNELKRERDELRRRYERAIAENARLSMLLDRERRRECFTKG